MQLGIKLAQEQRQQKEHRVKIETQMQKMEENIAELLSALVVRTPD